MQRPFRGMFAGLAAGVLVITLVTAPLALGDPTSPSPTPNSPTPPPIRSSQVATPPAPPADSPKTRTDKRSKVTDSRDTTVQGAQTSTGKITLKVVAKSTPIAGHYFEGIGSYGFSGTIAPIRAKQLVEIWWSAPGGSWRRFISTTTSSGTWSVSKIVHGPGVRYFYATVGDHSPTSAGTVHSPKAKVTVEKTSLKISAKSSIDSLTSPKVTGTVFPARPGVLVHFQVRTSTSYHDEGEARTDSAGRFAFTFSTGKGNLHSYYLRARYWIYRSQAWQTSPAVKVVRARVLNAKITRTTKAEVADTYHAGCPVGRSELRTITMNYEGFDHKMHRGVLIIRADLAKGLVATFGANLGRPIRRMDNPNVWGGSDPKQMEADNTSGFNCRKVTGNPYAQSPHSYGIAIDINTRENPYRDVTGKWWPKSGKAYIKRSPWKNGMLTKTSVLTKQLRSRGYFWGALWYPGRDYQHFEYDK